LLIEVDFVAQGLPVVEAVSKKIARRLGGHVPVDDLRGIGNLALLEVARSYDPSRSSFSAYVASRLKWAIFDGLRRETHGRAAARLRAVMASEHYGDAFAAEPEPDAPTTLEEDQAQLAGLLDGHAAALALGLLAPGGEAPPPDDDRTPEDQLARAELGRAVRGAVRGLPDLERAIIERHYYGGEPFDGIARDLGLSKSWVSRLHGRAIGALARSMRDDRA
jgi:RNA polymerase sigma factor for flagellar operon FliA